MATLNHCPRRRVLLPLGARAIHQAEIPRVGEPISRARRSKTGRELFAWGGAERARIDRPRPLQSPRRYIDPSPFSILRQNSRFFPFSPLVDPDLGGRKHDSEREKRGARDKLITTTSCHLTDYTIPYCLVVRTHSRIRLMCIHDRWRLKKPENGETPLVS